MAINDQTAYVLVEDGLAVMDLSRPDSVAQIGFLALQAEHMQHVAVHNGMVFTLGTSDGDEEKEVLLSTFDVRSSSPRFTGSSSVPNVSADDAIDDLFIVENGVALVRSANESQSTLTALQLNHDGDFSYGDQLLFPNEIHRYPYGGVIFSRRGVPHLQVVDERAFIGLRSGLAVVDVSDATDLRLLSMTELEPGDRRMGWVRKLSILGDSLLVARHWPGELVMMDVSDPSVPVEIGTYRDPKPMGFRSLLTGRHLIVHDFSSFRIFDVLQNQRRRLEALDLHDIEWWGNDPSLAVSDGHLWALVGESLVAWKPKRVTW